MEAAIFDDLTALADATRSRMLLVLERHELTVTELCAVLQLPQSTVSRHLKTLSDTQWVSSRRDGTSRYYTLALDDRGARDASPLVAPARAGEPHAGRRSGRAAPARRARAAAERSPRSSSRPRPGSGIACARTCSDARRICTRCPGCSIPSGSSAISAAAPARSPRRSRRSCQRVIAVDRSDEMLQAARRRVRDLPNVDVRRGELEALPIADGELDAATLLLVLHHLPDPVEALAEAARVLRPGGRLLISDMLPHDREAYRQQMGHVWLGFGEDALQRLLTTAGFERIRVASMPADPDAKGPALFVAGAEKRKT